MTAPASIAAISGQVADRGPAGEAARAPAGVKGAPSPSRAPALGAWLGPDLAAPVAILGIVLAMIVPLPPALVDVLLSVNITASLVVLLVAVYIVRPVDFSVFPAALLLLTMFRLALNISSSRLILLEGSRGTAAAGAVIEAFGNFVVGGNYLVGVVIFLVLIAIQYVVINHGAVRISEVTARFTLDALPGKQMSIDSDLNAGLIDESEAKARRRELAREAEFYGAMDGASRFTQRDAVASLLITLINIVAGFLIGVLQNGMELKRALATYTVLTIGDGLVTVVPALMVSVSGGLIVTRAGAEGRLTQDLSRQVLRHWQPLVLAAGALAAVALLPGLPAFPFLALAAATGTAGWRLRQESVAPAAPPASAAPASDPVETSLRVDPVAVEVGLGLVRLVEGGAHSPLLRRIAGIRRQLAGELGFVIPPVRVTDNLALASGEYVISIKGGEAGRFEIRPDAELAIHPSGPAAAIAGTPAREPAFGLPAVWVPGAEADAARLAGYTVVDAASVLATHLAEVVRRHAADLFTRQEAKKLLDRVAEENPKAVEDLVPKLLPLATVQRVFQNLLRERAPLRDAASIVEALGEAAPATRNPVLLTEYARQAIRRILVKPYLSGGQLAAYVVDPALEQAVESAVEYGEHGCQLSLAPHRVREILDAAQRAVAGDGAGAVVVTSAGARFHLRQILETAYPNLPVLSHAEVPSGVRLSILGRIGEAGPAPGVSLAPEEKGPGPAVRHLPRAAG
jgi:flagellar biosynthesis protein FlhA